MDAVKSGLSLWDSPHGFAETQAVKMVAGRPGAGVSYKIVDIMEGPPYSRYRRLDLSIILRNRATHEEATHMKYTTFVGLDVHKDSIAVATARASRQSVESLGVILNNSLAVTKLVKKLESTGSVLAFCYEAGPCGYGLYRQLVAMGHYCIVVAPSLVPQKPGDRVKTDRRDARKLATYFRSGDLTPVWVPDEDSEALRDLVRARESSKEDLHRCRQRLGKFLLRLGIKPPEGVRNWTLRHKLWVKSLNLDYQVQQIVLSEHIYSIEECENRVARFECEIEEQSNKSSLRKVMAALQGLRGISLVTAATIISEVGDLTRFENARQLMSYAGLVPSEDSSGNTIKRGCITKAGNSHLRRVVVESAWHYRHKPSVGIGLKKRQETVSEEVKQISWKAQHRLNLKYRRMLARGKNKQKTAVGVDRVKTL